jgi:hypothetical protein
MDENAKPEFHVLVETWWSTAEALEAMPGCEPPRASWHAHVFERILEQCGWTVQEWNEAVDLQKKKA